MRPPLRRPGRSRGGPAGTLRVVDPSPLNWLYITYNTVEEPVRVTRRGEVRPAAMRSYRWRDGGRTLELRLRANWFPDGSRLTAESVRRGRRTPGWSPSMRSARWPGCSTGTPTGCG